MLTMPAADASVQQIAQATAFAKRNIAETLDGLHAAGLVVATAVANERRYSLDRGPWATLLHLDPAALPGHRSWPQLLFALRRLLRFLADPRLDDRSGYMRASVARDLVEEIAGDLSVAGGPMPATALPGDAFWGGFEEITQAVVGALRV